MASAGDGQRFVDDLSAVAKEVRGYGCSHGHPSSAGGSRLPTPPNSSQRFGDDAGFEAAARAERSRDDGNVVRFCHWRQIERVIATLSSEEVRGTVH
jgi:hypothetical protein